MRIRTVMVVVGGLLLAGCATPRGETPGEPPEVVAPDRPAADPVELVDLWRVSGAEGEGPDTWLRLDAGSYQLWRDCGGLLEGGWSASGRVFVASAPFMVAGDCGVDEGWPEVPWLQRAVGYAAAGDGWALLGADGAVLATLSIDGAPEPIANAAAFYAEPPEVTDDVRARFAEPAPLPDGLVAIGAETAVGRWEPAGGAPNDPFVELAADGTWTGSDGCNGSAGSWGVDTGGRLLATAGLSTAIGCDGAPVPSWLASAGRAGFDGEVLVLVDAESSELARLVRG